MTRNDEGPEPAGHSRRRHRIRWLAAVVAAVVVISGFVVIATWSHRSGKAGSAGTSPALAWWANFPVDASPRPVVLTGSDIVDPTNGFPNGGDKAAYVAGLFTLRTTLPTGPSTMNGQRLSSAADALADLRGMGGGKDAGPAGLAIIAVRLGTATFSTDRGRRTLPAWSFRFPGVAEPAFVLAIPSADRWPRPGMPMPDGMPAGASPSSDGSKITVSFIGAAAGTEPCEAEYTADLTQSRTAVEVSVRQLPNPHPSPITASNIACAAVGYPRTVTVALQPPLGNRVLVDSRGVPLGARSLPPGTAGG